MSGLAARFRNLNNGNFQRFLLFLPVYLLAYKYGSLFSQTSASPLWAPDSVLLCWLLASPRKQWWVYLVAPLPIRLALTPPSTIPLWFLLIAFANDSLKGLFSGYVLRRILGHPIRLDTMRAFSIFVATAATAAPILSALGGAAARHGLGYSFWPSFYEWFLGNSLAGFLITPTLLYWFVEGQLAKFRLKELALLGSGLAVVSYYALVIPHTVYFPLLLYAPLPFLIWAVVRTGPVGTATALSLLSIISILSSALGKGVFSVGSPSQNVLSIQLFLLLASVPLLFLAVLVEERRAIQDDFRRSKKEVGEHLEQIRIMAGRLITTQDEERRRIARDLHDSTGQNLVALATMIFQLRRSIPLGAQKSRRLLSKCRALADQCVAEIRTLSYVLHPPMLDQAGIGDAVRDYLKGFTDRSGIKVDLELSARLGRMPRDVELALFRVMQESLTNVQRHSGSPQAKIRLGRDRGNVILEICDGGCGGPETVEGPDRGIPFKLGVGITSMQERMKLVGGRLEIDQTHGGTTVRVVVPIEVLRHEEASNSDS